MSHSIPEIIDYDRTETWLPLVGEVVEKTAPVGIVDELRAAGVSSELEAVRWLLERVDRDALCRGLKDRCLAASVRLYHVTRVSSEEADSIKSQGLAPLNLVVRREKLEKIFRQHPRWSDVAGGFGGSIDRHIKRGDDPGREDGCVHAGFSAAYLLKEHIDILAIGAEVDHHIAYELFGNKEADGLFAKYRQPLLIAFGVKFDEAVYGADALGQTVSGLPGLIEPLVGGWALRAANPLAPIECRCEVKINRAIAANEIAVINVTEQMVDGLIVYAACFSDHQ